MPLGTSLVAQLLRICLPMQGHGFEPWSGKIPHAAEQLSPCATTTEPACRNYWSSRTQSPCSATREATARRSQRTATKGSPRSPQLEKARVQQWRPNAAKNKINKYFFKKNNATPLLRTLHDFPFHAESLQCPQVLNNQTLRFLPDLQSYHPLPGKLCCSLTVLLVSVSTREFLPSISQEMYMFFQI